MAAPCLAQTAPPAADAGNQAAPTSAPSDAWWNDAVFYEAFVRSFKDSASGPFANDGIGDFDGMTEKLDYLSDGKGGGLGVTGLWLMPIFPSPSYHGYDVSDYYSTNPDYGTVASFKRLLKECHKRRIRVILDLTLNHCSSEHQWFKDAIKPDSPTHDWFVWTKEAPPRQGGAYGGSPWHKLGDSYYYGIFSKGMPDFNCTNPKVTNVLQQLSRFWLQDVGIDGFRLDAVRHLIEVDGKQENTPETHAWLRDYRTFLKKAKSDSMTVGEVWDSSENAAAYVGDQLDMVFEFQLAQETLNAINKGDGEKLRETYAKVAKAYPRNQYGTFLTNHDQTRVMNILKNDPAKAKLAATLLLTGPGVPFIYYGEEIGMTGDKPDEHLRTPMQWAAGPNAGFSTHAPWQAANKDTSTINVEAELADPSSLLRHYQRLIKLRKEHAALRRGELFPVTVDNTALYSFLRTQPGVDGSLDAVLVVVNLSDHRVTDYALTLPASPLRSDFVAADLLTGNPGLNLIANAQGGFESYQPSGTLGPYESFIVHLKKR
jgi:glycosidase